MIRFDHVSKVYPGNPRPALSSVDLEILRGEFVFLVGASGSGKSSFLRLVLKEDRPTQGTIHVLGQQLNQLSSRKVPYYRRSLGVVFQDFRLLPNKSVFDNVAFSLQVIGKSKGFISEAVTDVLSSSGSPARPPACRTNSPVVSSSAWRSPARSSTSQRSSSPTSPPATSTR